MEKTDSAAALSMYTVALYKAVKGKKSIPDHK